jgi:hypothetical protein
MDIEQRKAELLEHYTRVRADLMAAIEGLSEAQMTEPTLEGWSVQDHLAHLAAWDEVRSLEIARISAGGTRAWPLLPDDQIETFNQLTVGARRAWTLPEALVELAWTRQHVLDVIAVAAEPAFDESRYGESGLESTHDLGHAAQIREWRVSKGY